ncbi:MAG: hypothetical protein MI739_00065 [Bacteroidales bacterium]|nr:hypothetical protein [Bacteroidales bacterium]
MVKVVALLLFRGLSMIVSFYLSVLIVNVLGTEKSGVYFYIVSFVSFSASAIALGLGRNLLKEISLNQSRISYINSILMKSVGILSISYFIFIFIFRIILDYNIPKAITENNLQLAVIIIILPFTLNELLSFAFQGVDRLFLNVLYTNIGVQILLLISFLCNFIDNIETLLTLYFWFNFSLVIFGFITFFRKVSFTFAFSEVKSKVLLKNSFPLFLSNVVSQLFSFILIFFVEFFHSSGEVSYFSVCLRIATALSIVNFSVSRVYAQRFGKLVSENNWTGLKRSYFKSLKVGIFFLIPAALIGILFSKTILSIYNKDFVGQFILLIVLMVAQPLSFLGVIGSFILQMLSKEMFIRNIYITVYLISILVSVLLIYKFSVYGAAITLVINYSLIAFLSMRKVHYVLLQKTNQ